MFKPEGSLNTAFVDPSWLKSVRLSRTETITAEHLMVHFFNLRKYHVALNESSSWSLFKASETHLTFMSKSSVVAPPVKFSKLLRLARKDPYAVIVMDPVMRPDPISVMTLLDFVRVLVLATAEANRSSEFSSPPSHLGRRLASASFGDQFAQVRGLYLTDLFSDLMSAKDSFAVTAPAVQYFEKMFNSPQRFNFFKDVAYSQLRSSKAPEASGGTSEGLSGLGSAVAPSGVFLFFRPKIQNSFLVDDVLLKLILKPLNLTAEEGFFVVKSGVFRGVLSPEEVFPWDHVFVETSNMDFSLNFLLMNLQANYPTVTLPGCVPPCFDEFFVNPAPQRVYMRQAAAAAKLVHDQLIN